MVGVQAPTSDQFLYIPAHSQQNDPRLKLAPLEQSAN
jgi:hypothetical protein